MPDVAAGLEQEIRELVALAERVAYDDAFRINLESHPVAVLNAAGMPEAAAEQLLKALDVPDEVLARMPEVVAHRHQELPLGRAWNPSPRKRGGHREDARPTSWHLAETKRGSSPGWLAVPVVVRGVM